MNTMNIQPSVTSLPTELLILILRHCAGEDILNFAEAFQNSEMDNLVKNKVLWRKPKVGPKNLRKYLKYFGPHTREITIVGFVTLNKSSTPKRDTVYDKSDYLPDSVISSIRLSCPNLVTFNLQNCVIDIEKVKLSLFPKTLKNLRLICVDLKNKSQEKLAVNASPFFGIMKALPKLETLLLENPWYLRSWDSLAIISGCKLKPSLTINGSSHLYTFGEESAALSRSERRNTSRHFIDLMDSHNTKKK